MDSLKLYAGDEVFDAEDLTYREKRDVRRLVRAMWDPDIDGPFSWEEVAEDDAIPPTIAVFWHRDRPDVDLEDLLEEALNLKPRDVNRPEPDPPTVDGTQSPRKPSRKRASVPVKTSLDSGSLS